MSESINLSNCDKEVVAQINQVQEFGAILVVDHNMTIVQVSANVKSWLHHEPQEIVGTHLSAFLSQRQIGALTQFSLSGRGRPLVPVILSFGEGVERLRANATAHKSGEYLVLELERIEPDAPDVSEQVPDALRSLPVLNLKKSEHELLDLVAHTIRDMTGYDRVMVYKFHEDLHGEVIAERCAPDTESFLGFHYPASDIPAPARRLFEQNWTRIIVDVNSEPVALVPPLVPGQSEPLDLTMSVLRQPSSIHVEYLKNMGVGASLTVSLIVDDRLWGLIACHHRSAKFLNYWVRSLCEFLGKVTSSQLARIATEEKNSAAQRIKALSFRIAMATKGETAGEMFIAAPDYLPFLRATSMALIDDSRELRSEHAPAIESLRALKDWLDENADGVSFHTHRLSQTCPQIQFDSEIAMGVLAVRVGRGWLMVFRREHVHQITWSGNPEKNVEPADDGRLHPRTSFAAWLENVRGESMPWTVSDETALITLANMLAVAEDLEPISIEDSTDASQLEIHETLSGTAKLLASEIEDADIKPEKKARLIALASHYAKLSRNINRSIA